MSERFLITGALGCIGAWTVRNLLQEGAGVTVFDLDSEPRRLRLVLTDEELAQVNFVTGDITDLSGLETALDANDITHVIHLAGLQVPFCKADPALGARVNVVGTVNVFESVKRRLDRIKRVTYASSIAVNTLDGIRSALAGSRAVDGPHLIVAKVANTPVEHIGRVTHSPTEIRDRFKDQVSPVSPTK